MKQAGKRDYIQLQKKKKKLKQREEEIKRKAIKKRRIKKMMEKISKGKIWIKKRIFLL